MGRAEELFHSIQSDGITAIEQFITERRSEELFLDFKRSADDGNLKNLHINDLNNYGRAISGFGNSSGGIIVWGIDCSDLGDGSDVARAKRPLEDPKRFVSWLEKKTSGRTLPAHSEVIHHAIEIPGQTKGFVITLIPKSDWAPHQEINSKCYFMRVGSNFEHVPHGILEGFFGRRIQAKIVHKFLVKAVKYKGQDNIEIQLGLSLRNEGRGLAEHAFLNADIITCPTKADISFQPPSTENWISHFTLGISFTAVAREGVMIPPRSWMTPLVININLNSKIDKGICLHCCCGSENSQPIHFELGCSMEDLQACYSASMKKIKEGLFSDQDAIEASRIILGLQKEEAIGNSMLK